MTLEERLIARFGTSDILEVLGPAGAIPPTQTLCSRLSELGLKGISAWCKNNIPPDLYAQLKPYQHKLAYVKAVETNIKRYGSACPTNNPVVKAKREATCLSKYGVTNAGCSEVVKAKIAKTNLERYGVTNPLLSDEVKSRVAATNLSKYGVTNLFYDSEFQQRITENNISKYGGRSPFSSEDIRRKAVKTTLEHYGVAHAAQTPEIRAKREATNLERYGNINPFGSDAIKEKIKAINLEKYGGSPGSLTPDEILARLAEQKLEPLEPIIYNSDRHKTIHVRCLREGCGREFTTSLDVSGGSAFYAGKRGKRFRCCECQKHGTNLEHVVRDYICSLGYTCEQRRFEWMGQKEIDCYIEELGIGFEINGHFTHNSTLNRYDQAAVKPFDYHATKTTLCLENGIRLYHIWHSDNTPEEQGAAIALVEAVLSGQLPEVNPGDTISRDVLPDPTVIGLPYLDLGPQPFEVTVDGNPAICYTSGLWKFLEPDK